jgi:folate-binding protein YgfZ
MPEARLVNLEDRGVLAVSGEDRIAFLQGLVSNDVERVTPKHAVYAAFLTPQGKFLFDFIVVDDGERLLLDCEAGTFGDYDRRRIQLGIPDGSRDMEVDKTVLLEAGFDELNGVDWKKGCYMGQELTARTKYRGLVKRRLMPITTNGPLPPPGTRITLDGRDAGEIRSTQVDVALAIVRLNMLERTANGAAVLTAGEVTVTPQKPDWATF